MALISPESAWTTVGFAYPAFGSAPMDFVTTAPAPFWAMSCRVSTVYPRMPEAKAVGLRSFKPGMFVVNKLLLKGV